MRWWMRHPIVITSIILAHQNHREGLVICVYYFYSTDFDQFRVHTHQGNLIFFSSAGNSVICKGKNEVLQNCQGNFREFYISA